MLLDFFKKFIFAFKKSYNFFLSFRYTNIKNKKILKKLKHFQAKNIFKKYYIP